MRCNLKQILAIIDGHDWRTRATSFEDAMVKDADKLWRFGLEGVTACRGWMGMGATDFLACVEAKIPDCSNPEVVLDLRLQRWF
jgi:hypothetical protein